MRAAFVGGRSRVDVRELGAAKPRRGELLVRMRACGVCGSDVEKVFGDYAKPSMRLGHEPAGVIAAVGEGVTEFAEGDRVFTHHHVPCMECRACSHGDLTLCERYSASNLEPCGLAEEYVVPEWNASRGGVLRLPDSVTFEEAAMIEPLACCVRAWRRLEGMREGDTVAILGAGPTGAMHAMIAASRGARAICSDVNESRLRLLREGGACAGAKMVPAAEAAAAVDSSTGGRGADAVIVATSAPQAIADALAMARSGGTVMIFGVPPRGSRITVDAGDLYARDITLSSSYAASDEDTRRALEMIAGRAVPAGALVTHRYPIGEAQRALDHARSGEAAMKVIVEGKA